MSVSIGALHGTIELHDTFTSTLKAASGQLATMGAKFEQVGRRMTEAGTAMSIGITAPLVAAAGAALKFSSQFETSLTKVGSITNIGVENMGEMREAILKLAPAVGVGPTALSDALLVVASTGLTGASALAVLEQSAKASAIGLGDAKDVARAVTSAITAYGEENLNAEQATRALFVAVKEGGAEANEFAGTLGRVVGIASQVGVSFDEVLASIATFTRLGVDAAEATTALRGVMSTLLRPTKDAREQLEAMGSSIEQLRMEVREKGLTQALVDLVAATQGNDDALAAIIPNIRALAGVMGTAGAQADAYGNVLTSIKGASTEFDDAVTAMSQTLGFKWNQAVAQAQTVLIKFGDAIGPAFAKALSAMTPLLDGIGKLAQAFATLPPPVQTATLGVLAMVAAAGPLLLIGGQLIKIFGLMSSGLGLASTAVFTLGNTVPVLTARLWLMEHAATASWIAVLGPIAKVVAAIALVTGALIVSERMWSSTTTAMRESSNVFAKAGGTILSLMPGFGGLTRLWTDFGSILRDFVSLMKSGVIIMWESLKRVMEPVGQLLDGLISAFERLAGEIETRTLSTFERLRNLFLRLLPDDIKLLILGLATFDEQMKKGKESVSRLAASAELAADQMRGLGGVVGAHTPLWQSLTDRGYRPALTATQALEISQGNFFAALQKGEGVIQGNADAMTRASAKLFDFSEELRASREALANLDPAVKQNIASAIALGIENGKIAEKLKINVNVIELYRQQVEATLQIQKKAAQAQQAFADAQRPLTEQQKTLIAQYHQIGLSNEEIASVVKRSAAAVGLYTDVLDRQVSVHKELIKAQLAAADATVPLTTQQAKQVQQFIQIGLSIDQVSTLIGRSDAAVKKYLGTIELIGQTYKDSIGLAIKAIDFIQETQEDAALATKVGTARQLAEIELRQKRELEGWTKLKTEVPALYEEVSQAIRAKYRVMIADVQGATGTMTQAWVGSQVRSRTELAATANDLRFKYDFMRQTGLFTTRVLTEAWKEWADAAREAGERVRKTWSEAWQGIKDGLFQVLLGIPQTLAQAFTGGGNILGAVKSIATQIGATVGGGIGFALGGPMGEAVGQAIGSLAGPLVGVLAKVFDRVTGDIKRLGREMGQAFSEALTKQIKTDTSRLGDQVAATLVNLPKIISEAGGIETFGIERAIAKTRDLFVLIETRKLSVSEAGKIFQDVFTQIAPAAIDQFTGRYHASFIELLTVAKRFGVGIQDILKLLDQETQAFNTSFGQIADTIERTGGVASASLLAVIGRVKELGIESEAVSKFLTQQTGLVTSGFNAIAQAMGQPLLKQFKEFADASEALGTARDQAAKLVAKIRDLETAQDKARASGKDLTESQKTALEGYRRDLDLTNEKIGDLTIQTDTYRLSVKAAAEGSQDAFSRAGRLAVVAFNAAIANGQTFLQAITSIGSGLDTLAQAQKLFGFEASQTFAELMQFRQFAEQNEELVASIDGVNQMMRGLHNTGQLTATAFADLQAIAVETFDKVISEGISGDQALRLMQPTLQTIWTLQQDFGHEVDETTQKLIDQAVEAGIVGDKHRDVQDKIRLAVEKVAQILERVAQLLGVTLVDAAKKAGGALTDEAGRAGDAWTDEAERTRRAWELEQVAQKAGGALASAAGRAGDAWTEEAGRARRAWEQVGEGVAVETEESGVPPGFQFGTRGNFMDFGAGRTIQAHGHEAIVPRGGGSDLAREIAAAMGGIGNGPLIGQLVIQATGEESGRELMQKFVDELATNRHGVRTKVRRAIGMKGNQ